MIPEYKDSKITPFRTNQELIVEKKEKQIKKMEKDNALANANTARQNAQNSQFDPLLELKINQPLQQMQKPVMPEVYPSPYVPIPNPYYPLAGDMMTPWQYTPNNVPIIKKYNISLGNGNGDITKLASLYEDILPSVGNISLNTFNTLKERIILHNYIRSIFIKTGDGEEVLINGGMSNNKSELINLLSHIKLLEINPYHYSNLTRNPYKTLPNNFVMYRSCYPIKMTKQNIVSCASSSIGMNIRIHLLSITDNKLYNTSNERFSSDIWRELDYYQYIREEVIKPGLSPNFITIHSYFLTKNTGINFKKFDMIRANYDRNLNIEKTNADIRNKLYIKYHQELEFNEPKIKITVNDLVKYKIINPVMAVPGRTVSDEERKRAIELKIDSELKSNRFDDRLDSDKCLIMLTEAPTHIIYNWATRTYIESNGAIKKMIHHGYYDDKVWESIFFQLLISLLILFEKEIAFSEFSLKNNVFIKDLNHGEQNVGLWKYVYNGIEYFVPNYGYILLIDTNFADLVNDPNPTQKDVIKHKIQGKLFNDDNTKGQIYKLCLEQMINSFDSNLFSIQFTSEGGVAPSRFFLDSLDRIKLELDLIKNEFFTKEWEDIFKVKLKEKIFNLPLTLTTKRVFNMMHSRIGTKVSETELKFTSIGSAFDHTTKSGTFCVHNTNGINNRFVLYLNTNDGGLATIITTNEPIYNISDRQNIQLIQDKVPITELKNYYSYAKQWYEPGKQHNILETYLITLN